MRRIPATQNLVLRGLAAWFYPLEQLSFTNPAPFSRLSVYSWIHKILVFAENYITDNFNFVWSYFRANINIFLTHLFVCPQP